MKLHFVCIGAQKAGTTTLHDILKEHPDICLPEPKEAHFFEINERYKKGTKFFFETFFTSYQGQKYLGNINPNLQIDNRNIDRLYDCFGQELKIIFILRDPVKRAYSHYLMTKRLGYESLPFFVALEQEEYRRSHPQHHDGYETEEIGHYEKNICSYINRGLYSETVSYLFKVFPRENVKLILFEQFIKEPERNIAEILEFLQIPKVELDFTKKANTAVEHRNNFVWSIVNRNKTIKSLAKVILKDETRTKVKKAINKINSKELSRDKKRLSAQELHDIYKQYFEDDIRKLEPMVPWNLDLWKH